MQTDGVGSASVITEGNSLCTALTSFSYSGSVDGLGPNHLLPRFTLPFTTGEAMSNFDGFFSMQPRKNATERDGLIMESIPLPSALMNISPAERYGPCSPINNQEKLTSAGPFGSLSGYTKTGISSFEMMLHDYEGLPNGSCLPDAWAVVEPAGLSSNGPGSSRFSNELSLSLATSQQPSVLLEQCSDMSSSGLTSYSLDNRQISSSSNCYKPLQLPMPGSRFVQAMQEILADIARYALENVKDGVNISLPSSCIAGDSMSRDETLQEQDAEARKKHLLYLLELVDDQYNQCVDQIHTVTSAFHAATELDPTLHARFALRAISFMYKSLRERIISHILAVGADVSNGETREDESFEAHFVQKQWAIQQLSKRDHQFWRPQRGLPERSVSILRAWMFQNFLHPYPKDAEKHLLAVKSGLTRNQVSNWFINARVRLWKPMIEEMCAEMGRRKSRRNNKEVEGNNGNHVCFDMRRFTMDGHG